MDQAERIEHFYKQLYQNEFIRTHAFERYRFGNQEFFACASTLKGKNGREITVSFNIHDDYPDEVELVMQFLNQCSLEQLRIVGEDIAKTTGKDINVYEEPDCISMVSYFDIDDVEGVIQMFMLTLERITKVVFFVIKPEN